MILKKIIICLCVLFLGFSTSFVLAAGSGDISGSEFMIDVGNITPGDADNLKGATSGERINSFLGIIITKLITAFGVLSLLVMTIGAGFMIIYHGQDELLTRGKSIFSYGLISLVVALSAGMLVKLVSYLLYGVL